MAKAAVLFSMLQIWLPYILATGSSTQRYARLDTPSPGQRLNHVFESLDAESPASCCASCSEEDRCLAVSFAPGTGTCELNDKNPEDYSYFGLVPGETPATLVYHRTGDTCEQGWFRFDRHCYLFSSHRKTWAQSAQICRDIGARLVSINNGAENTFIYQKSKDTGALPDPNGMWLGLSNYQSANPVWEDGQPMTFAHFHSGTWVQDCLAIWAYQVYGWVVASCSETYSFACEKKLY